MFLFWNLLRPCSKWQWIVVRIIIFFYSKAFKKWICNICSRANLALILKLCLYEVIPECICTHTATPRCLQGIYIIFRLEQAQKIFGLKFHDNVSFPESQRLLDFSGFCLPIGIVFSKGLKECLHSPRILSYTVLLPVFQSINSILCDLSKPWSLPFQFSEISSFWVSIAMP